MHKIILPFLLMGIIAVHGQIPSSNANLYDKEAIMNDRITALEEKVRNLEKELYTHMGLSKADRAWKTDSAYWSWNIPADCILSRHFTEQTMKLSMNYTDFRNDGANYYTKTVNGVFGYWLTSPSHRYDLFVGRIKK